MKRRLGIFTKPIHVEKIVNFLNGHGNCTYLISTKKQEVHSWDFDFGVSYCFPWIVDVHYPMRDKRKWFNYHPAPLPEYPGLTNYSQPVRDGVEQFGVTLHRMTDDVDQGEILQVKRFPLASKPVNSNELGCIAHYYLFQLFKETINRIGSSLYEGKGDTEK